MSTMTYLANTIHNWPRAEASVCRVGHTQHSIDWTKVVIAIAASFPIVSPIFFVLLNKMHIIDEKVLETIAENPDCDQRTLAILAGCSFRNVKEMVAENRNTSMETLMLLAEDNNANIKFQMAENHNIPSCVLEVLAQDENPYVKVRALTTLERLNGRRELVFK